MGYSSIPVFKMRYLPPGCLQNSPMVCRERVLELLFTCFKEAILIFDIQVGTGTYTQSACQTVHDIEAVLLVH